MGWEVDGWYLSLSSCGGSVSVFYSLRCQLNQPIQAWKYVACVIYVCGGIGILWHRSCYSCSIAIIVCNIGHSDNIDFPLAWPHPHWMDSKCCMFVLKSIIFYIDYGFSNTFQMKKIIFSVNSIIYYVVYVCIMISVIYLHKM